MQTYTSINAAAKHEQTIALLVPQYLAEGDHLKMTISSGGLQLFTQEILYNGYFKACCHLFDSYVQQFQCSLL